MPHVRNGRKAKESRKVRADERASFHSTLSALDRVRLLDKRGHIHCAEAKKLRPLVLAEVVESGRKDMRDLLDRLKDA